MSYSNSLYSLDHNLIFAQRVWTNYAVQSNTYAKGSVSSSGILFKNSIATFNGNTGFIEYKKNFGNICSIRLIFTPKSFSKTESPFIIQNANQSKYISLQQVSGRYRLTKDGGASSTLTLSSVSYEIVIVFNGTAMFGYINGINFPSLGFNNSSINAYSLIRLGGVTSSSQMFTGSIELFEIYNKILSVTEINLLFLQRLYSDPSNQGNII